MSNAPKKDPPPKMNRAQLRAFRKYLKTPEGQKRLAEVKAANARKAEEEGQRLTVTSPERVKEMESMR